MRVSSAATRAHRRAARATACAGPALYAPAPRVCDTHVASAASILGRMSFPATAYKNRRASRCPCLVCQTLTEGEARDIYLGYGVTIRLCARHASIDFIRADSGRHFSLTVHQALRSAGRLTRNHVKALDSFIERHVRPGRRRSDAAERARPGSYAWREIRMRLEERLARGSLSTAAMAGLVRDWLKVELRRGRVSMPSLRTLRRWRLDARWLDRTADAPT